VGAIDRTQLMAALRAQALRKIAYLFMLPSTTEFAFYPDTNLLQSWGGPELVALEPLATIWSAVRARGDEPVVDAMLARLGPTTLKLHEKSEVSRFGFSPQELTVIDLIRARPCSLADLVASGVLPKRSIELVVYALVVARHLDHGADSAPPIGIPRLSDTARLGNVPLARVKLATRPSDESASEMSDRGRSPSSAPPPSPRSIPSSSPPAASLRPTSSIPPSSPRAFSPQHSARYQSVLLRAESIDRENYFAMLGVGENASQADLQAAYYSLAKTWHPDRLPPELSRVRELASKVFARMSEAFDTLSDVNKRKRYVDVMRAAAERPRKRTKSNKSSTPPPTSSVPRSSGEKNDPGAEQYILRAYQADPDQATTRPCMRCSSSRSAAPMPPSTT